MKADRAQRQRREVKYLVSEEKARAVGGQVREYLEPDESAAGRPDHTYGVQTLYLDSDNLLTYHAAAEGWRNRFKLRVRYYDDDPASPVFLEIKRRLDEGILKQRARVRREAVAPLLAGAGPDPAQLHAWDPRQWADLIDFWRLAAEIGAAPRLHNAYEREAYESRGERDVRVTIDRRVRAEPEFGAELTTRLVDPVEVFPGTVILELKFTARMPEWMLSLVRDFDLRRSGAAKYGEAVERLGPRRVACRPAGRAPGSEWAGPP